jgi:hypothetical protein
MKNNNFIEELEKEFDKEFGTEFFEHLNCECMGCDSEKDANRVKQFISQKLQQQREELKKEIVEMIDNELMPDDEYNGCWITTDKDGLIDKIKNI